MGEKNGDAKTFWTELEDEGKIDFIFEQVQNVLQALKQKIKNGSATNKEYIQAMILVNEATISNNAMLIKDHVSVIQDVQDNTSSLLPSTSHKSYFPEDSTFLYTNNKESHSLENDVDMRKKEASYQSHTCSGACLMKMPPVFKSENPLQLPIKCHFQRQHAKTNSHSSALHVSYKTPCGRSLRNMEEVFRYLLETECNFLFTDNFSFNTYVQLTRNYSNQEAFSDVDISNGVESVPISLCNEIDNRKFPHFKYRKTIWPRAYYLNSFSKMFTDSCDCSEGCIDITKCACLQLTARIAKTYHLSSNDITPGYKYKRLQRHIPTGIYECNLLCKCNRRICQNRVVQHGPQVRLQVFKTKKKGWGVRCLDDMDRGTFVCIYSGRLLSRSNTEKSNDINENAKKEKVMDDSFSKKRKIEVADCEAEIIPLALETHLTSAEIGEYPSTFINSPKKSVIEMKCKTMSRIQYHSVIRSPKAKIAIIQRNGENMKVKKLPLFSFKEFASSESIISEDSDGFLLNQVSMNSTAKEMKKDASSEEDEDSKDILVIESDVMDITKCRKESPPRFRCNNQDLDNKNIITKFDVQIEKPQEKQSTACHNQQDLCDEELLDETENIDSLKIFNSKDVFMLDASKEGNVGRFLNHSCCPNLLVQNVFVETHDRKFPLMAFFTNRYVKARTELTWDYGYKTGTMPEKEILCQCGFNKCRKKIL